RSVVMGGSGVDGVVFFFSSRRGDTRLVSDWSSDVCSSDLTRSPDAPADIGLGCPSICGGIIAREGHDDMIAVQPAPHGINSSLGETSRRANLKTTVLPDANSQKGVHPNANVSV